MPPQHWLLEGYNPWVYRNKRACILPTKEKRPKALDMVEFRGESVSTVYFVNDMGLLVDQDGPRYSQILYIPPSITLQYPGALLAYHHLIPYYTMQASVRPDDAILVDHFGSAMSLPPSTTLVIIIGSVSKLLIIKKEGCMMFPLHIDSLQAIQKYLKDTAENLKGDR